MYLSIRDTQIPEAGYPTLLEGLRDLGVPAMEVQINRDYQVMGLNGGTVNLSEAASLKQYKEDLKKNGIKATSFLLGNNFGVPELEREIQWVIGTIRIAAELGMNNVRIDAIMKGEREQSLEARQQHFADCMKRVLKETEKTGIRCGIENHGFQGNDPNFLMGLMDRVGSPRLGLTMDMGNFYWAGHPIEKVYEILEWAAPRSVHTHIKNINYPADKRNIQREMGWEYGKYVSPLAEGDIDLGRVIRMLKKAGYQEDLCIEDESIGKFEMAQRKDVLRKDVGHIQGCLG